MRPVDKERRDQLADTLLTLAAELAVLAVLLSAARYAVPWIERQRVRQQVLQDWRLHAEDRLLAAVQRDISRMEHGELP
jgi:hypothetical protein